MCLYLFSGKFFRNESVNRTEGEKQVSDIDLSPGDARPLTVVSTQDTRLSGWLAVITLTTRPTSVLLSSLWTVHSLTQCNNIVGICFAGCVTCHTTSRPPSITNVLSREKHSYQKK